MLQTRTGVTAQDLQRPEDDEQRQTPDEVVRRISGVPKSPEEQKLDEERRERDREKLTQTPAGTTLPTDDPKRTDPTRPTPQSHVESEREAEQDRKN